MNILDYTYDLHKIENKIPYELQKEFNRFLSLVNSDFTKQDLLESVLNVFNTIPELISEYDVQDAYESGRRDGYEEGYEEAKYDFSL